MIWRDASRNPPYDPKYLFTWDHDPQEQVNQNAGHATWNKGNDHRQTEPKGTDPKEFGEPTANTCQHAIAA
jgi:hypothetical protein